MRAGRAAVWLCGGWLALSSLASAQQQSPQRQPPLLAKLSQQQREFIAAHPVIRIGVDRDFPPLEFADAQGAHSGLTRELLDEIANRTGLVFEPADLPDWPAVIAAAERQEVDLLPGIVPTLGRESYLQYSRPYLELFEVIVTRREHPLVEDMQDFTGRKVAMMRGFGTTDVLTKRYPQIIPVLVKDAGAALMTVSTGGADATTMPLFVANYQIGLRGLSNLKIAAPVFELRWNLLMGVRKDWPLLTGIVNAALADIEEPRLRAIREHWLGASAEPLPASPASRLLLLLLGAALLLILLAWFTVAKLRREARRREALRARAEDAEKKMRGMAESVPGVVWQSQREADGRSHYRFISPRVFDLTGYSAAESQANGPLHSFEIIHPQDYPAVRAAYDRLIGAAGREALRYRLQHKSGQYRWVQGSASSHHEAGGVIVFSGVLLDASQTQQLEQQRDDALRLLRDIANSIPGSIWQFRREADGRQYYSYMSEGVSQLTGRTPEETNDLMQSRSLVTVHPDDQPKLQALMARLAERGGIDEEYYRVAMKSGGWKWVRSCANGRREADGSLVWNGISLDATRIHDTEVQLAEARLQLQNLVDSIPGAVWRMRLGKDGVYRFEYVSEGVTAITGRHAADIVGDARRAFGAIPAEQQELLFAALNRCARARQPLHHEFASVATDGRLLQLLARANVQVENGDPLLTGVLLDVTERYRLEQALAEARVRIEEIASAFPGAIWQMRRNAEGHEYFSYMSENIQKLTGRPASATLNRPSLPFDVMHPEDRDEVRRQLFAALDTGSTISTEYRLITADGTARWVHIVVAARRDGDGSAVWNGVVLDATEQKNLEAELKAARAAAEDANRAKSRFLANMSHEIRTPLNAVIGLSHLALDVERDAAQRDRLSKINRAGKSQLRLLNDLLDFSRLEAHKLSLLPVPFALADLLDSLGTLVAPAALEKGLSYSLEPAPELPALFIGDPQRIQQVLLNLLANAAKFTDAGGISLAVAPAAGGGLRFTVSDTGRGMTAEELGRVFEAFEQADAAIGRRHGGSGLGLSICRELVRLMGGEITASSAAGAGSAFIVSLPLPQAQAAAPSPLLSGDARQQLAQAVAALARQLAQRETAARAAALRLRSLRAAQGQAQELDALERLLAGYDFESAEVELARLSARWGVASVS